MVNRYQRGNQNLYMYIIEEQTTQWSQDTKEVIWLPLWYLVAIVLFVLLWYTCIDSDYLFGIFWPLCCLFFYDIHVQILITSLVSCGHCVVCSSLIYMYRFWLSLWYLLTIVLFVLLWYTCTDSDYLFSFFCSLFVYHRRTNNTMVKRYQRGNQNLYMYINEEQTTQWPQDTKEVIRICTCISKKNKQHNGHKIPKR
jgi:hypothetical protein